MEGMEEFLNPIIFGIVAFEFAWDFCEYQYYKRILEAIKNAPVFDDAVASQLRSGHTVAYGLVHGQARAIGQPIRSALVPGMTGVVQRFKVVRYLAKKDFFGSWRHSKETVKNGVERTRFGLLCGNTLVHLTDHFTENIRLVHLARTGYEIKQVSDEATGLQQVFELTERLLKEDTPLTALGELTFNGVDFVMRVPVDGTNHFLTTGSVSAIEEAVDGYRAASKVFGIVFGSLSTVIVCVYLYRRVQAYWSYRCRQQALYQLEMNTPEEDLPYSQRCVVCRYYARDVVLMPCRHFCLCRACLYPVNKHCPVCRAYFHTGITVYVP